MGFHGGAICFRGGFEALRKVLQPRGFVMGPLGANMSFDGLYDFQPADMAMGATCGWRQLDDVCALLELSFFLCSDPDLVVELAALTGHNAVSWMYASSTSSTSCVAATPSGVRRAYYFCPESMSRAWSTGEPMQAETQTAFDQQLEFETFEAVLAEMGFDQKFSDLDGLWRHLEINDRHTEPYRGPLHQSLDRFVEMNPPEREDVIPSPKALVFSWWNRLFGR